MAKVTIGDRDYIVQELNFIAVQKTWTSVLSVLANPDPMVAVSAAISVIGAGLQEQDDFKREDFGIDAEAVLTEEEQDKAVSHFLKRKLKGSQIENVRVALNEIIEEAGLRPDPGELARVMEMMASRGMETSTLSSLDWLRPDVKEDAGTV